MKAISIMKIGNTFILVFKDSRRSVRIITGMHLSRSTFLGVYSRTENIILEEIDFV